MHRRIALSLGLGALAAGSIVAGAGIATANQMDAAAALKAAGNRAGKAEKALARHDTAQAVDLAEAAVTLAPRVAAYRVLLGRSYLASGRFTSARTAFGDALQLAPGDAKAILNTALLQIATGDFGAAHQLLNANAARLPAADYGLALALAGDPANAVRVLTDAARNGGGVRARQNLALAYALGGEWPTARVVASADVPAGELDVRMAEWAQFARPDSAADQVAKLLGVRPVADAGQPVALALNAPVAVAPTAALAAALPVPVSMPTPVAAPAPQLADRPVPREVPTAAPAAPAAGQPMAAAVAAAGPVIRAPMAIRFAAPQEVVQPLPITAAAPPTLLAARPSPAMATRSTFRPAMATPRPSSGSWYVQLGAFSTSDAGRNGWVAATRRLSMLSANRPQAMNIAVGNRSLYRLSVGGYSRAGAEQLCARYRAAGGECFIRVRASDQVAEWAMARTQLASR